MYEPALEITTKDQSEKIQTRLQIFQDAVSHFPKPVSTETKQAAREEKANLSLVLSDLQPTSELEQNELNTPTEIFPFPIPESEFKQIREDARTKYIAHKISEIKSEPFESSNVIFPDVVNGQLFEVLKKIIDDLENNSIDKRDTNNWIYKLHIKNSCLAKHRNNLTHHLIDELRTEVGKAKIDYPESLYLLEINAIYLLEKALSVNDEISRLFKKSTASSSLSDVLKNSLNEIKAFERPQPKIKSSI